MSQRVRASLVVLVGLALGAAAGCTSKDGTLEGSLSQGYEFPFSFVRARLYSSELAVEYVDSLGAVPVRVSVSAVDNDLEAGGRYDLGMTGAITGQRSDGTTIPRFTSGTIALKKYDPVEGAHIEGTFDSRFATPRATLALSGSFDTTLEVVTNVTGPPGMPMGGDDAGAGGGMADDAGTDAGP